MERPYEKPANVKENRHYKAVSGRKQIERDDILRVRIKEVVSVNLRLA